MAWKRDESAAVVGVWDMTGKTTAEKLIKLCFGNDDLWTGQGENEDCEFWPNCSTPQRLILVRNQKSCRRLPTQKWTLTVGSKDRRSDKPGTPSE